MVYAEIHRFEDIQPYGPKPDASFSTDFSVANYGTDITNSRGVASNILPQSPNYIYVRGNTNAVNLAFECILTLILLTPVSQATHVEISLYAIPCNLLIYPANYGQNQIMEMDGGGNSVAAIREIKLSRPGPGAVDNPFNFFNPIDPNTLGSDHYCLIAEARKWVKNPQDKPLWPHQVMLSTGADITGWILNTPTAAQRNTSFMKNPDAPSQIWQVNVTVPR
jgi:hypothetical protein